MQEIYELVRQLRAGAPSRNRDFAAYASEHGRKARRIHRFLRSVEKDVARAEQIVTTEHENGGVCLELAMPELALRRTVQLDRLGFALLLEDERVRTRLARATPRSRSVA